MFQLAVGRTDAKLTDESLCGRGPEPMRVCVDEDQIGRDDQLNKVMGTDEHLRTTARKIHPTATLSAVLLMAFLADEPAFTDCLRLNHIVRIIWYLASRNQQKLFRILPVSPQDRLPHESVSHTLSAF